MQCERSLPSLHSTFVYVSFLSSPISQQPLKAFILHATTYLVANSLRGDPSMFSFELDLIIAPYLNPAIIILLCIKKLLYAPPLYCFYYVYVYSLNFVSMN